jgi:hypothetical protein
MDLLIGYFGLHIAATLQVRTDGPHDTSCH